MSGAIGVQEDLRNHQRLINHNATAAPPRKTIETEGHQIAEMIVYLA